DIYVRLKGPLEEQDICLLAQGLDGGRTRLVEQFKAEPRSVLFGASSFWEGVDIPGEGLSCVVMVKLPFRPPTLPVVEARMEDLERRGLHPFGHLSLPEAIIRFKQGFGRLVRSQRDRGVVVVFDSRVDSVGYGLKFLKSLPGPSFYKAPMKDIADRVLSWIADP
ncbi:MAG: DNA polymerase III subunit epsilon, partial [Actinobacteria bacterium]|nr:DNA polymerase III subunit epsilon [Actinomycetota bacterium]